MVVRAQNIAGFPWDTVAALYVALLLMHIAPKVAGIIDALMTPGEVRCFGGGGRFALSAAMEILFSLLLGAVTTIRTSTFMVALVLGKSITWNGQQRDGAELSWRVAFAELWPQLLFGLSFYLTLAAVSPAVLLWSLPLTAGYLLAIPFAVFTASPTVGHF